MNRKNTPLLTSLLFATAIAGCSGPVIEPQRQNYGESYLRLPNGTAIMDACDAQGNSGSDGVADTVLVGEMNMHRGPYQYQLRAPGCSAARDAVRTIELSPELQSEATQMLRSYDQVRFLIDHAIWESRAQK